MIKMIPTHYDAIPEQHFLGNVLDIGARDGNNQRVSTRWPLIEAAIQNNRYHTTDIDPYPFIKINGDMFDVLPKMIEQHNIFDNILAIHVLEHLYEHQWKEAITLMRQLVAPYGTLVLGTPYIEVPPVQYRVIGPHHQKHHTFWIDCRHFIKYLGDTCTFRVYKGPYGYALLCFWEKNNIRR